MASNSKKFFIERTDFSLRLARLSHSSGGDKIEEVREVSPESPEEVKAFIQNFTDDSYGGYLQARCAIYPSGRLLRNCNLNEEDQSGLDNLVRAQFRINPDDYGLVALNADDGLAHDPTNRAQRNLFVCGAPNEELRQVQEEFLAAGVYPLGIELGSVATVGLLLKAMRGQQVEDPVLVVELGSENSHAIILSNKGVESAKPVPLGLNSMIAGVRDELGLKDEAAARRLFFSDSFDFREMGPRLIDRVLRELQSMTGFYEVQTGQSITRIYCSLLPGKLSWLNQTFASCLGMARLDIDFPALFAQSGLALAEVDPPLKVEPPLGLLGLMVNQEVEA